MSEKKNNFGPFKNGPKKDNKNKKPENNRPKIYWIWAIVAVALIGMQFLNFGGGIENVTWYKLEKEMLKPHDVHRIVIVNKDFAEIYIKQEKLTSNKYKDLPESSNMFSYSPHYKYSILSTEKFEERVIKYQEDYNKSGDRLEITTTERHNVLGDMLSWIIPFAIIIIVWIFLFRKMSGGGGVGGNSGIFNIGKSKAKLFDKETEIKIDFSNVAGLEEAKVEIREIVEFLKNPKKYTQLGGNIPKGALLIGPPGTGKTLLAKAVAGEAHVPFFSISGSDFVEMFVGVGASRVRDLFQQAKTKAPCIVFIDEIDAIGRARGKNPNMGANDERENTLNQLLTEMDGFGTNNGVIILAATNRADVLDRALLRAGRFDRQIHVELPDLKEREEIFKVHIKPLKIGKSVDVDFLAKQTPGFSGADIANVCNESALIAARKNNKNVEKQDFLDAVDRIIGGLEKKNKLISKEEKRTIAYHEAGHATLSWLLKYSNPLVKVTIIPRGKALGAAWYLPEERQITTTEQLFDEMCTLLGGRASEDINFGRYSTGALNDLERATKQAYAMVSYFGMSDKIGNISYYDSTGQSEYSFTKPYSEKTGELIDEEVTQLIESQYVRAKKILAENKDKLVKLSEKLLKKEVIFGDDLEEIFGKRKFKSRSEEIEEEKEEQVEKNIKQKKKKEKPSPKKETEEAKQDTRDKPKPKKDNKDSEKGESEK